MQKTKYVLRNADRAMVRVQYNAYRIEYMIKTCMINERALVVDNKADLKSVLGTIKNQVKGLVDEDMRLMICPLIAPGVRQILDELDWEPKFEVTHNVRVQEQIIFFERSDIGDIVPHFLLHVGKVFGPTIEPLAVKFD